MKLYMIPGLGADKRMYAPQLRTFPHATVLEHIASSKGESIADYALRFVPFIDTMQPFVLLGTSLGGMVAVELSRVLQPEKVILIASVKNRNELPYFIRSLKYLPLHKPFSGDFYKRFNSLFVSKLDNGRHSSVTELIYQMTADASSDFIEWAIDAVIRWEPPEDYRSDIFHLHGTKDLLFPYSRIKNAIPVMNGSHVMNLTMSAEVNRILYEILATNINH